MYDERLGTDWTDIPDEEAIDRAFALGVAASFGHEDRVEFDRLREALDTAYDRSIIDLAYEEGRHKADGFGGDAPEGDVWDRLVGASDAGDVAAPRDASAGDGVGPAGERPGLFDRAALLEGGADLGALRPPAFLDATERRSEE